MPTVQTYLGFIKAYFNCLGFQALFKSKTVYICSFIPIFFHVSLILVLFTIVWLFRHDILFSNDSAGIFADYVTFSSLIGYYLLVLFEIILKYRRILQIQIKIIEIRRFLSDNSKYCEFLWWFFRRSLLQITLWLISEVGYYFGNSSNCQIQINLLFFLYPMAMKQFRELHFIFYCSYCELLIDCLIAKIEKNDLKNINEPFWKIKELVEIVNRTFEWSLLATAVQSQVQLIFEIYWIVFGIVNESKLNPWPLIFCCLPKLGLVLSIVMSCQNCQDREKDFGALIQKFDLRGQKLIAAEVQTL